MVNAQTRTLGAVLAAGVTLASVILFTMLAAQVAAPVVVLIAIAGAYVFRESRYFSSWSDLHLRRVIGAAVAYSTSTALIGIWLAGGVDMPTQAAQGLYAILGLVLIVSLACFLVPDNQVG